MDESREKTQILLNYLRLIRPPSIGSTCIVIITGYLIMIGTTIDLLNFSVLFIIGVFSHIFGFVLNEYIDIKVDEKSQFLKDKPLVSGVVSKNHALFIVLFSFISAFALAIIFFHSIYPLLFLFLSLLFGGIYDIVGKKLFFSDIFIGGSSFFACLFGASIVSIHFTNLVYIISLSIFIFIIFCNAVVGGIKDVEHDLIADAKTTAIRLRVKFKNNKMLITKKFKIFSYALEIIFIILIIFAVFQPELKFWLSGVYLPFIILIFLVGVVFVTLYKFLNLSNFDKPWLFRLFMLNGTATYLLVPIVLMPLIGLYIMIFLLIFPTTWFIIWNLVLYGNFIQT